MDPIDLLILATSVWCGHDQFPRKYTQESIEICADAIYDCAVPVFGVAIKDENMLKACAKLGQSKLVKIKPKLAVK